MYGNVLNAFYWQQERIIKKKKKKKKKKLNVGDKAATPTRYPISTVHSFLYL